MNTEELISAIKEYSDQQFDAVRTIRRHLHAYPELSFQERETSRYIISHLRQKGIPLKSGIAGNGILARIEGQNPKGPRIALRADMDALPIEEQNDLEYKSKNPGVMHACGHDIHASSLLGAAFILNQIKNEIPGSIYLVFQPGEERIPGGARLMLEEGIFDRDPPAAMLGQHVQPDLPAGCVGFKSGSYMASSDEIYIRLIGQGGHAAMPEQFRDPIMASAHLVIALQQIPQKYAPSGIPTVLSIGRIEGAGSVNVIPEAVKMEGTFRTMNESWRDEAHRLIRDISRETAESMQIKAEVEIKKGYPVLVNNEKTTRKVRKYAIDYLGEDQVVDLEARMTAEDFAYFAARYPSVFYRLGVYSSKQKTAARLHSPNFSPDEHALRTGMGLMAYSAIKLLKDL